MILHYLKFSVYVITPTIHNMGRANYSVLYSKFNFKGLESSIDLNTVNSVHSYMYVSLNFLDYALNFADVAIVSHVSMATQVISLSLVSI